MKILFVGYDIAYAQFYTTIESELAAIGDIDAFHVYFRPSAWIYARLFRNRRAWSPWLSRCFGGLSQVSEEASSMPDLRFYGETERRGGRSLLLRIYALYLRFFGRLLRGRQFDIAVLPGEYRLFEQAVLTVLRAGNSRPRIFFFEAGPPGFVYLDEKGVNANASFSHTGKSDFVRLAGDPDRTRKGATGGVFSRTVRILLVFDAIWLAVAALLRITGDLAEINVATVNLLRRFASRKRVGQAGSSGLPPKPYVVFLAQVKNDINHTHFGVQDAELEMVLSGILGAEPDLGLIWRDHPLERSDVVRQRLFSRFPGRIVRNPGLSLGRQLAESEGAISVNSNAGLEALQQGFPVRVLGKSYFAGLYGVCQDDRSFLEHRMRIRASGRDPRISASAESFLKQCFLPVDYRRKNFGNAYLVARALRAQIEPFVRQRS